MTRRFVRTRRPEVQFVQDPTVHANVATMIPDGMHGAEQTYATATLIPDGMHATQFVDKRRILDSVVDGLVARGVDPLRARALANRASLRYHGKSGDGLSGLNDGEEDSAALLASVQERGAEAQNSHAGLIAQLGSGNEADRNRVRNAVESLYNDWTAYAVDVKNGAAPFQWNRLDPVDAILIAVRDDLRNTADLLAANKAQQVLAKQIAALPKPGRLPGLPFDLPNVPSYVWVGAAAIGTAIITKALKIW